MRIRLCPDRAHHWFRLLVATNVAVSQPSFVFFVLPPLFPSVFYYRAHSEIIDDFGYRASGTAHAIFCLGRISGPPRGMDNVAFNLSNSSVQSGCW